MTPRGQATAVAFVFLSVVSGACGGGDPSASGRTSPTVVVDGTTTTAAPVATPNTVEVGIDTARGSPETTATTSTVPAITAPPVPAPTGPVALTPPAPGTYHYATSGGVIVNGTPVPFPADTINTIGGPVGTRQVATREMRSSANTAVATYTFDYRPDGLYSVSLALNTSVSPFPPYAVSIVPSASLLFLATGAAAGASQTLDVPAERFGSARVVVDVLGTESVVIGNQTVDTLVVRTVVTFPPGQVAGSQTLIVNLYRASRLSVRERGTGDATVAGLINVHAEYTATIKSLTPG